jgi:hypothetical protein
MIKWDADDHPFDYIWQFDVAARYIPSLKYLKQLQSHKKVIVHDEQLNF